MIVDGSDVDGSFELQENVFCETRSCQSILVTVTLARK